MSQRLVRGPLPKRGKSRAIEGEIADLRGSDQNTREAEIDKGKEPDPKLLQRMIRLKKPKQTKAEIGGESPLMDKG